MLPLTCHQLEMLHRIARLAGDQIIKIWDQSRNAPIFKADSSPLTLADMASNQVIMSRLQQVINIPIVSEESKILTFAGSEMDKYWLVDPLDGTKEFLEGGTDFTVNIALIERCAPIFGIVFLPATGDCYWGSRIFGAFHEFNGVVKKLNVSKFPHGRAWNVVASKSHMTEETLEFIGKLADVNLIQAGSSLKFCRVAEGLADLYPRLGPTSIWDTAAAHAVVEGAGGHVVATDGRRLVYNANNLLNPYFVASSVTLDAIFKNA